MAGGPTGLYEQLDRQCVSTEIHLHVYVPYISICKLGFRPILETETTNLRIDLRPEF